MSGEVIIKMSREELAEKLDLPSDTKIFNVSYKPESGAVHIYLHGETLPVNNPLERRIIRPLNLFSKGLNKYACQDRPETSPR